MDLGDISRFTNKNSGAKSGRDAIVGDLFNYFQDREINLLRNGEMKISYFAERLSPFKTSDLYVLLGKIGKAKNPAAMFWWYVKPKQNTHTIIKHVDSFP